MYSPPPLQHPVPRTAFVQPPDPQRSSFEQSSSPNLQQQQQPAYGGGGGGPVAAGGGFYQGGGGYGNAPQQSYPPNPYGSSQPPAHSPYPQHPHQQQQNPYMGGGPNVLGQMGQMWGVNDATAQMGVQFGKSAIGAGQDYVEKTFARHLPVSLLKHSFAVSNLYVIKKLGVLLWPWRHGKWGRTVRRSQEHGQAEGWLPPREDINAPDLYIPTMSLVTYILLSALHSGLSSQFHPEVLGRTASKALGVVLLEFIAIKLGTYLLDVRGSSATGVGGSLEMGMYGGYKFVGIILTLVVSLVTRSRGVWWVTFLYTVAANAFFLLRSLKYVVLPDPSSSPVSVSQSASHTITHAQRTTRVRFLIFVAIAQVFLMGLLVWV